MFDYLLSQSFWVVNASRIRNTGIKDFQIIGGRQRPLANHNQYTRYVCILAINCSLGVKTDPDPRTMPAVKMPSKRAVGIACANSLTDVTTSVLKVKYR